MLAALTPVSGWTGADVAGGGIGGGRRRRLDGGVDGAAEGAVEAVEGRTVLAELADETGRTLARGRAAGRRLDAAAAVLAPVLARHHGRFAVLARPLGRAAALEHRRRPATLNAICQSSLAQLKIFFRGNNMNQCFALALDLRWATTSITPSDHP